MKIIWKLYEEAIKIVTKLCMNKCASRVHRCEDYIRDRIERNDFKALKNYVTNRGAKSTTYLHMLVNSRLIDFVNSAKERDEILYDPSIIDESNPKEDTYTMLDKAILDKAIEALSSKDKLYLQYQYVDELSHKEIATIEGETSKYVSNYLGRIYKKLEKILEKGNYTLEDLL